MTQYVESACPSCHHPVRIRTEYLGKRIACKHCNHTFVAQPDQLPPAPTAAAPQPPTEGIADQGVAALEEQLKQVRAELAARTQEHAAAEKKLTETQDEANGLRTALRDLQRQLEQAHESHEKKFAALQADASVLEQARQQLEGEKKTVQAQWEQKHQAHVQ
ncbi:MAG TPA: hypothetical protein VGY66_28165, partial [Gemmataceae bacterium]|nr:hypothetical protein [Gemmataceae bacterium]